jgi:hypothetical protein
MWRVKRWVMWMALPFIILGAIFLLAGTRTDPAARTDDGYSLKWFWYIMGLWFIGLTLLVYGGIFYFVRWQSGKMARLEAAGLRGFATVLSSGATGSELNNMPKVEMELRVELEGRPAYVVTHREYVNPVNLASVQAGRRVPVLVDRDDYQKLTIDWNPPAGEDALDPGI